MNPSNVFNSSQSMHILSVATPDVSVLAIGTSRAVNFFKQVFYFCPHHCKGAQIPTQEIKKFSNNTGLLVLDSFLLPLSILVSMDHFLSCPRFSSIYVQTLAYCKGLVISMQEMAELREGKKGNRNKKGSMKATAMMCMYMHIRKMSFPVQLSIQHSNPDEFH